jgi:hypothetical protein
MRLSAYELMRVSKLIVVLCFLIPISSRAAEFSKIASRDGGPDIILVAGRLVADDDKQFLKVAINSGNAIVVFESPGGNLLAGIGIGKAIRLKGLSTFVPHGVYCASACALAWLGGRSRYMSETANVGFHAVYVKTEGQAAVSSAGNALVGAYLNQLGLPTSAIIYITEAPPEGMQWLSFVDAQRYGIDVQPFNLAARQPPKVNNAAEGSFSSQALR